MEKLHQINYELKMISQYQGLKFSRYYTLIILFLYSIYGTIVKTNNMGIYFIFFYIIITIVLLAILDSNKSITEEKFILHTLKKKADFSMLKYKAYNLTNYVFIIFLLLWLFANMRQSTYITIISFFPFLLSVSMIIIKNCAMFYYLKRNNYLMKYNLL